MDSIVPDNKKGKSLDLEETVKKETKEEAVDLFRVACERLKKPWTWHDLAGMLGTSFTIKNKEGKTLERPVAIHDYLEINIPAPGQDWVRVEEIIENSEADESLAIKLKVSPDPEKPGEGISHFFGKGASSTFIIMRKGNEVTASYHGRNETPNTESETLGDKVRNSLVALGAIAGFSNLQWTALLKGFLAD